MTLIPANSVDAVAALALTRELQELFCRRLTAASGARFEPVTWLRDGGLHGGGTRLADTGAPDAAGRPGFNRASLNVSQVHYDDLPDRRLGSATALSCIVHPVHPLLPSLHLHISLTAMKSADASWRLMADLNPAIPRTADTVRFRTAMRAGAGSLSDAEFEHGCRQGDRYFDIPVLGRRRGVAHFYLEQYRSGDRAADLALAGRFGRTVIEAYVGILADGIARVGPPSPAELEAQRAYHTLYLFQVLTLDRGTTSGLLVHDQNDLGILGSLPARVDRRLLATWVTAMPVPQDRLLRGIVDIIPADGGVGDGEKLAMCRLLRRHYAAHPEALELQARADLVPPTVANHLAGPRPL